MSKKVKAAAVNQFIRRQAATQAVTVTYPEQDDPLTISVTPHLSFAGRCALVRGVADMCFGDGGYQPCMYRLAWGYQLLAHYTNLTLPTKAEAVWSLISQTGLLPAVTAAIRDDLDATEQDVREEIRVRCSHSKWDDVADGLAGLTARLNQADSSELAAMAYAAPAQDNLLSLKTAGGKAR